MAIVIKSPVFLNEQGRRKNNEDSIYPPAGAATDQQRLFMVCDGVGGANKGEVASRMVCEAIAQYFQENITSWVDEAYIVKAIRHAEARLQRYTSAKPECAGMSTTLTLVWLDDQANRAVVAWVGDSRVYQMRQGKVQFMTDDHSLVNELVKRGELRPEDAAHHPQRNVILRAISADSAQPAKADVVEITDLQIGDYFLLCSDGILESIDEPTLSALLPNADIDLAEARLSILEACELFSHDNFSMYLFHIAEITPATASPKINTATALDNNSPAIDQERIKTAEIPISKTPTPPSTNAHTKQQAKADSTNTNRWLAVAGTVCLLLVRALGIYKIMYSRQITQYGQLIKEADSLRLAGNKQEAMKLYEQALQLFPNKADAQQRIEEIQTEARNLFIEDSLRSVVDNMLADSLLLSKAGITRLQLEEAKSKLDIAIINNYQVLLDSVKNRQQNGDTTSVRGIIQQNSQAPGDTNRRERY